MARRERSSSRKKSSSGAGKGQSFYRGSAGRDNIDSEVKKAEKRREQAQANARLPFRFWLKPGETREVVILDEEPDFFIYEHNLKDDQGRWSIHCGCVKTWDNCPVCEEQKKESTYVMFLSILDLTQFASSDGTEHEFSRKLLPVKIGMQKKFTRKFGKLGSLRGQVIELTRDTKKDPQIGGDIDWIDEMDEDELAEYTRTWQDREGKKHTEDCSVPYVYEEFFEEETRESLMQYVKDKSSVDAPGSTRANRRALEEDDDKDLEGEGDDVPFDKDEDEDEKPRRSRRRGRSRSKDEEEEDEKPRRRTRKTRDEEEEEEDEKPRRRTRKTRDEEEEEEDEKPRRRTRRDEEEEEEDEKPRRSGRRRARKDEEEEDEKPRRSGRRTRR